MEKIVLTGNLVDAIYKYMSARPYAEVANIMLAMQQQIAQQMPKEATTEVQTPEQVQ